MNNPNTEKLSHQTLLSRLSEVGVREGQVLPPDKWAFLVPHFNSPLSYILQSGLVLLPPLIGFIFGLDALVDKNLIGFFSMLFPGIFAGATAIFFGLKLDQIMEQRTPASFEEKKSCYEKLETYFGSEQARTYVPIFLTNVSKSFVSGLEKDLGIAQKDQEVDQKNTEWFTEKLSQRVPVDGEAKTIEITPSQMNSLSSVSEEVVRKVSETRFLKS